MAVQVHSTWVYSTNHIARLVAATDVRAVQHSVNTTVSASTFGTAHSRDIRGGGGGGGGCSSVHVRGLTVMTQRLIDRENAKLSGARERCMFALDRACA